MLEADPLLRAGVEHWTWTCAIAKVDLAERDALAPWTPPGVGYRDRPRAIGAVPISLAAAPSVNPFPIRGSQPLGRRGNLLDHLGRPPMAPNRYTQIGRPVRSLSLWRVRTNFRREPAFGLKPLRRLEPKRRTLLRSGLLSPASGCRLPRVESVEGAAARKPRADVYTDTDYRPPDPRAWGYEPGLDEDAA